MILWYIVYCLKYCCSSVTSVIKLTYVIRESRDHEVIPLTELKSKKDFHFQPKPTVPLCSKDNLELILYCETCDMRKPCCYI